MEELLLTNEEMEKVVKDYEDEDCVHALRLSRGHWEDIASLIAKAQAKKIVEWLEEHSYKQSKFDSDLHLNYKDWQAFKGE